MNFNNNICNYCNRKFKRLCDLTKHINIKHIKITRPNKYSVNNRKICPKCKREITIINFNKHFKSCEKQKLLHKDVLEILNKCVVKDNKYICFICNKEFNRYGIGTHIWRKHTESGKDFDNKNNLKNRHLKPWNKGLTKETDKRILNSCETYKKNQNLGLHKKPIIKNKILWKNKISNSMVKAHKDGRAWNIGKNRWNNKPSYPESWFIKVIENEFDDKNYIREFPFYIYSLDFAWKDKKKCIEIDGQQHELKEYKERDIRKDKLLNEYGWKVLRLKWKDICKNAKYYIKLAKNFIEN